MMARQMIKEDVLRRIRTAEWPVGACIPTLDELETLYPYSRRTISLAIGELGDQGILGTRGKAGTMVYCAPGTTTVGLLANYGTGILVDAPFVGTTCALLHTLLSGAGHSVRVYQEAADFLGTGGPPCPVMDEDIRRNMLAGVITIGSNLPEWERRHPDRRLTIPVVNISYHPCRYRVYLDFDASAELAVTALRSAGRRRVGMIGNPWPGMADRFRQAAAKAGLEVRDEWMLRREVERTDERYGFEALHTIWEAGLRPEALFMPDDIVCKGVAQAALALGIRVPDELLLLYQKNVGIDHFFPFEMVCLELPLPDLAREAVELLRRVTWGSDTQAADIRIQPVIPAPEVIHA